LNRHLGLTPLLSRASIPDARPILLNVADFSIRESYFHVFVVEDFLSLPLCCLGGLPESRRHLAFVCPIAIVGGGASDGGGGGAIVLPWVQEVGAGAAGAAACAGAPAALSPDRPRAQPSSPLKLSLQNHRAGATPWG
jgi:hypothetical protein